MDVEDEFFSVLKSRETEIMEKDRQLAESIVAVKQAEQQRVQAEQQRAEAEEKVERMMRNSVTALLKKQMTADDISDLLGIDILIVKQIAAEEHLA
jgi:hypothetical protein